MSPVSVCNRTQHHSGASWRLPEPPPICRSLRKVTASIRVIFIGSVEAAAARSGAGSVPPAATNEPTPICCRKLLRVVMPSPIFRLLIVPITRLYRRGRWPFAQSIIERMLRRNFLGTMITGTAVAQLTRAQQPPSPAGGVFIERPADGQPHKGKVLLALQAHSADIPLSAAGTVAKLIEEGYTGYLVRATNDDK